jgi:hypothetical protein
LDLALHPDQELQAFATPDALPQAGRLDAVAADLELPTLSRAPIPRDCPAALLRKSIEFDPERVFRRKWLVAACGGAGRLAEAARELALLRAQDPDFSIMAFMQDPMSNLPADAGRRAHLREALRRAGAPE